MDVQASWFPDASENSEDLKVSPSEGLTSRFRGAAGTWGPASRLVLGADLDFIDGLPGLVGDLKAPLLARSELAIDVFEQRAGVCGGLLPSCFVVWEFLAIGIGVRCNIVEVGRSIWACSRNADQAPLFHRVARERGCHDP